jgi:hypothetical protein
MQLGPSGLMEPPNVAKRTPAAVQKAFTATSLAGLNKAINDSNIPVLSEVQHSRGGADRLRQLKMFYDFWRTTRLPINQSVKAGFTRNSFAGEVMAALDTDKNLRVSIGRAEDSQITPSDSLTIFEHHQCYGDRLNVMRPVEGYGHEAGDDIAAYAMLGRLTLEA